jgi:UDP-N-acetylglucosamine 2-epimerase
MIKHVMALAPAIGLIRFYLHEPTERALVRAGLMNELQNNPNFELRPLGTYPEFTAALVRAEYILTDGGSVQEEASYLCKPCLVLRKTTERNHGLGDTAMLTSMNAYRDLEFLQKKRAVSQDASALRPEFEASNKVLDALLTSGSASSS